MSKYSMKKETYILEDNIIDVSKYDYIGNFKDGIAIAKKDKFYGCINKFGEEICPFIYNEIHDFKNKIAKFAIEDNNKKYYGLINSLGHQILPNFYEEIGDFYNNMAVVKRNGKYGYINLEGSEVIKPIYDSACDFNNNRAILKKDNTSYIINSNAKLIKKFDDFKIINFYNENCATVIRKKGKNGVIDKDGNVILKPQRNLVTIYDNGIVLYNTKNYYVSVIDKSGKVHKLPRCIVNNFINDNVLLVDDYVSGKEVSYLCDLDGNKLTNSYVKINKVNSDILMVKNDESLFGLIDINGNIIVDIKYDYIKNAGNDVFLVKKDNCWGLINKNGRKLTEVKYNIISDFDNDSFVAKNKNELDYLNKDGKIISTVDTNENIRLCFFNDKYKIYKNGVKYAIYDLNDKPITDFSFDSIDINEDMIIFNKKIMVKLDDLKFKYKFILEDKIIKDFDSIKKRDNYYNIALKELKKIDKEYEKRLASFSNELGNVLYKDIDKIINMNYKMKKFKK